MRKVIIGLLFLTLVGETAAQKQNQSRTLERLRNQVENGNFRTILDAAESGDVMIIPYLRQLASKKIGRNNPNQPAFFAHVALAKLGDDLSMREILSDVDDKSPAVQDSAIYKLALTDHKVAFRKLFELLDDTRPREDIACYEVKQPNKQSPDLHPPFCDVIYFSRSVTAIHSLRKTVKNPPPKADLGSQTEIDTWKDWLSKNLHY